MAELAATGMTQVAIAKRYGVAPSVITEVIQASRTERAEPSVLFDDPVVDSGDGHCDDGEPTATSTDTILSAPADVVDSGSGDVATTGADSGFYGLARLIAGEHPSRYAGASLLYPYLSAIDAGGVLSTLAGGPARRYDDLSVLAMAMMAFALGLDTVEGTKHLRRDDAGALVGVDRFCELRALRDRLSALADGSDPLALQRAMATRMLGFDPPLSPVYYIDDHFVAYSGAQPVAKGWNTKRRHAQPGRDDTFVSDDRGRAVVFASGEPSGLSQTMTGVLAQLREVVGADTPVMVGFDRGGSYPVAFKDCRAAGMDWVTYRRGKLEATTVAPKLSWCVRAGRRVMVRVADEIVDIKGYGPARQLTLFEGDKPVLQILTSDTDATAAALVCWLRGRWCIENLFKYAEAHNGIDSIASYAMELVADDRSVKNPVREQAKAVLATAQADLAQAEQELSKLLCDPGLSAAEKNDAVGSLQRRVEQNQRRRDEAKAALNGIPAKVKASDLDPAVVRAMMRFERRGLQMVLRLLAFNAEAWTAEHFNAYLEDPDEFRAILRHLLHLGGVFSYGHTTVTVTLHRPDTPKVARAIELLVEELNAMEPHMLGDRRTLRYKVAP